MKILPALLIGLCALPVWGQTYPNKPVRLIISFTPGSSIDIVGRAVAAKLQEMWGQPVVAENRPGAGGTVGSEFVVRSDPDGYTLLAELVGTRRESRHLQGHAHDTLRDFANLAARWRPQRADGEPRCRLKTLGDFVRAAKANPGKLNFRLLRVVAARISTSRSSRSRPAST
jgi:tripartite-type tricarboxylate transporter receptor subunit TctC